MSQALEKLPRNPRTCADFGRAAEEWSLSPAISELPAVLDYARRGLSNAAAELRDRDERIRHLEEKIEMLDPEGIASQRERVKAKRDAAEWLQEQIDTMQETLNEWRGE